MNNNAVHLGDGVYLQDGYQSGDLLITTNHHDPSLATDKVYLDESVAARVMKEIARRLGYKVEVNQ